MKKKPVYTEHQEKKFKEAISFINDMAKIRLAPSAIHGIGVFAMRKIKKGEKLYASVVLNQFDLPFSKFDKLNKEASDLLLGHFPLIVQGSQFIYPVAIMSAYLNHSDRANYDAKKDIALKDIEVGEEITENYRRIKGWEKVFGWLASKK